MCQHLLFFGIEEFLMVSMQSIVCAGLYPNMAATREGIAGASLGDSKTPYGSPAVKDRPIWYDGRREVHIHPSSVNYSAKGFQYPFLAFLEKVRLQLLESVSLII